MSRSGFAAVLPGMLGALALGCGSGGGAVVPVVPPLQATTEVFDSAILHYVELEVAEEHLPTLVPFGEERVPARLVYDGVELLDVGVRIKGGTGSARPLTEKAAFSIKTNEFVSGQKLHGIKKFTLDNEVQDPSLLAAHVGYELFRRAGLASRRTAFARVTFNGEYFGVYLVAEGYDGDFVERSFAAAGGNLYEAELADVTEPEEMQLETNEDEDDRSDLEALRDLTLSATDEAFLAGIGDLVDVDAYFRYWACEVLVDHWDGYLALDREAFESLPNNYYVYSDPERGLVWIPHGIDQILGEDPWRMVPSVLAAPSSRSALAARMFALFGPARVEEALRELLAGAWDADALIARLDAAIPLIEGSVPGGRPGNPSPIAWRTSVDRVREFIARRAGNVELQLATQ